MPKQKRGPHAIRLTVPPSVGVSHKPHPAKNPSTRQKVYCAQVGPVVCYAIRKKSFDFAVKQQREGLLRIGWSARRARIQDFGHGPIDALPKRLLTEDTQLSIALATWQHPGDVFWLEPGV